MIIQPVSQIIPLISGDYGWYWIYHLNHRIMHSQLVKSHEYAMLSHLFYHLLSPLVTIHIICIVMGK